MDYSEAFDCVWLRAKMKKNGEEGRRKLMMKVKLQKLTLVTLKNDVFRVVDKVVGSKGPKVSTVQIFLTPRLSTWRRDGRRQR